MWPMHAQLARGTERAVSLLTSSVPVRSDAEPAGLEHALESGGMVWHVAQGSIVFSKGCVAQNFCIILRIGKPAQLNGPKGIWVVADEPDRPPIAQLTEVR